MNQAWVPFPTLMLSICATVNALVSSLILGSLVCKVTSWDRWLPLPGFHEQCMRSAREQRASVHGAGEMVLWSCAAPRRPVSGCWRSCCLSERLLSEPIFCPLPPHPPILLARFYREPFVPFPWVDLRFLPFLMRLQILFFLLSWATFGKRML